MFLAVYFFVFADHRLINRFGLFVLALIRQSFGVDDADVQRFVAVGAEHAVDGRNERRQQLFAFRKIALIDKQIDLVGARLQRLLVVDAARARQRRDVLFQDLRGFLRAARIG